ncbi:Uncharacterized protein SAPIO_CDS8729 [Scedosporium apiospermum]|uniref:FAD-binding PCMH-type domain-containing protein n=1 Tax=Pseudallescheria apiosperma TaxID=563466 RepID=A0A084FYU2_PSEDA|nr:Uncharacterized protein SAPIO_CDS8729 [Scedosporium apiospermum]KEZ40254.1 Uncharacterized protein SAPIO_CDS8729 [Scedosporium apiospermum]
MRAYDPSVETQVLTSSSPEYEQYRTRIFNSRQPNRKPIEIVLPRTTEDVVVAINRAGEKNIKVGVRSGGHLFAAPSVIDEGMLIDTKYLNKSLEYDAATKVISFSPGHTVEDLANYCTSIKRFFPFGHSRSVGIGGFLLAGGQGLYCRGHGYTCETWVTQIEVVLPSGEVVIASKTQNHDLWWAAWGAGQGFFGVLTRIWGRTNRFRQQFDVTYILDSTECFKPLLKWALDNSERIPRHGVDLMIGTLYADAQAPGDGDESEAKRVFMVLNATMACDSIEEAKTLSAPLGAIPEEFKKFVVAHMPVQERGWEDMWDLQDKFIPSGQGERYRVDSIIVDNGVSNDEIVEACSPALFELPTRKSTGTIIIVDWNPDEADQALSLPQRMTVATMVCYHNPELDVKMDKWSYEVYKKAEKVGLGQYIADFDAQQRLTKLQVMTDSAMTKWLKIREKYDPEERFIGYRSFKKSLELKWNR